MMSGLLDFISGFVAASSAGKMPSTKQSNALADWLLHSPLIQVEQSAAGSGGKLSEHGEAIARDLREIVQAYQAAANEGLHWPDYQHSRTAKSETELGHFTPLIRNTSL